MKNKLFGLAAVAAMSLSLMTGCPSSSGGGTSGSASGTATSTATTTATTTVPAGTASGAASSTASSTAPASGTASGTTTTKTTKTGAAMNGAKVASVAGFDPKATFQQKCAGCHGANGGGGMCPSLIGVSKRRSDDFIVHRITVGSAEKGMPAFGKQLTPDQIKAMAAYVKTL